jgi:hypothetical protein
MIDNGESATTRASGISSLSTLPQLPGIAGKYHQNYKLEQRRRDWRRDGACTEAINWSSAWQRELRLHGLLSPMMKEVGQPSNV